MKLKIMSLLLVGTMMTAGADAATVVDTQAVGPTTTDFDLTGFSLSGFNSALGTLTGVTIDYTFGVGVTGSVTNTSSTAKNFTYNQFTDATFDFSGAYAYNDTIEASVSQGYTGLAAHTQAAFGPFTVDGTLVSGSTTILDPDALSNFIGHALLFEVSTDTSTFIQGGGGNITSQLATLGAGSATITYTYDEAAPSVPEAATWAMMLGGFGLMGGAMRQRRRTVSFS